MPLNLVGAQVIPIGRQQVSPQAGARYFAEKPDRAPDWGLRAAITFIFLK